MSPGGIRRVCPDLAMYGLEIDLFHRFSRHPECKRTLRRSPFDLLYLVKGKKSGPKCPTSFSHYRFVYETR